MAEEAEVKIEEDIRDVLQILAKKIRYVDTQIPVSEEHQTHLDDWKEKLVKQRKHLGDALDKLMEEDNE